MESLGTPQQIQMTIRPLQDEIAQLREERELERQEVAALRLKIDSLERDRDTLSDNQLIQLRLIHELKERVKRSPGKTELSRAEKIERYLVSRLDHKASYETLKGFLEIDDVKLNLAIAALMREHPGKYARQKDKVDGRKKWLTLIPKIV